MPDTSERRAALSLSAGQEERAVRLHADAIVIDCGSLVARTPAFLERVRQGGVTTVNHHPWPVTELVPFLHEIGECRAWVAAHRDLVQLVERAADIRAAKAGGRFAVILGPQNSEFLGTDLKLVTAVRDLGVRIMQVTYQRQNHFGCGCGEARDGGLTHLGRALVRELESAGVVVDLAHAGQLTAADAFDMAHKPPIVSHANPARMSPHIRAFDDDTLRRLAAAGGVIGITGGSQFLYDPEAPRQRPGLDRWVKHVLYVAELIGIDHVGIGLDFLEDIPEAEWNAIPFPELKNGWSYAERRCLDLPGMGHLGNVTRALVQAGLTDGEIQKVLGLNFLRVFDAHWPD